MGLLRIQHGDEHVSAILTPWDGTVVIQLDPDTGGPMSIQTDSDFPTERVSVSRSATLDSTPGPDWTPYWVLIAPAVLALVFGAVMASGVLGVVGLASDARAYLALHIVLLVVAATADLWLYNDAVYLEQQQARWQPNPYIYFASGGALITVLVWVWIGIPSDWMTVLTATGGLLLYGLVMSSTIAGPVYLLIRSLRIGLE